MDSRTLLKNILLALRAQGKEHNASAIGMFIALVRFAFSDENLTQEQICDLCNIHRATLFRSETFRFELLQNATLATVATLETKEKGKEKKKGFPPDPLYKEEGEKGKESVCADGTPPHTHDSSNDDSKGKKGKKQQPPAKETEAPVVLREPKAFNRFYRLYPKKSKMRQEKEKLKRLWHQCELDGWSGETILQALETAIRSERWTEKEGLYKPNAFKFLEEELMRDFLPIGYAPTPLVDASEENAEAEAHPGMIYKLGVWWTPEELQAYADSMIIPERLKGKVQI